MRRILLALAAAILLAACNQGGEEQAQGTAPQTPTSPSLRI